MNRAFPLQTLLDLSNLRLDEAAKQLGRLLSSEAAASEKLQLLMTYREDYQAQFVAAAREGLRPEAWSNYQGFLARLDSAITEAQRLHQQSVSRVQNGQQEWLRQQNKTRAFDTLADRHSAQLAQRDARMEQKQMDEFSSRTDHARRRDEEG